MKTICRLSVIGLVGSSGISLTAHAAEHEFPIARPQLLPAPASSVTDEALAGLSGVGGHVVLEHDGKGLGAQETAAGDFLSTPLGQHRYELTFSGRQFVSRDRVEGHLLYRAARVARARGYDWFVLLHLPGERGANDHPARRTSTFGAAYGHWQPHWTYQLSGQEWQPWRPEWGVAFWADAVPRREIEQFSVHAIIEGRRGPSRARQAMAFNAGRIIRDLRADFETAGASAPPSQ